MTRSEYFGDWLKVLEGKEMDQTLSAISDKYGRSGGCCPLYTSIFKAFHVCDYNNLKSVWIGMDPYPEKRYATGILFGNPPEVGENIAPSLRVIKDAVFRGTGGVIKDNSLESIARQGVLMINYCLTTEEGKTGTDIMLWMPFITHLIKRISEINSGIVYLLFGRIAQRLIPHINPKTSLIMTEEHPAYYSRQGEEMPSDIFRNFGKEIYNINKYRFSWE